MRVRVRVRAVCDWLRAEACLNQRAPLLRSVARLSFESWSFDKDDDMLSSSAVFSKDISADFSTPDRARMQAVFR